MNIIIPIGGKGERFKNAGYNMSKPLIEIFEKPMIFYILDNLNIENNDTVYIIYNILLDNDNFSEIIKTKYKNIILIPIQQSTRGAAENLYIGLNNSINLNQSNKNIILDCDTFYNDDIIDIYRNSIYGNIVFYSIKQNEKPVYSYITLDDNSRILSIKEKNKISKQCKYRCILF